MACRLDEELCPDAMVVVLVGRCFDAALDLHFMLRNCNDLLPSALAHAIPDAGEQDRKLGNGVGQDDPGAHGQEAESNRE